MMFNKTSKLKEHSKQQCLGKLLNKDKLHQVGNIACEMCVSKTSKRKLNCHVYETSNSPNFQQVSLDCNNGVAAIVRRMHRTRAWAAQRPASQPHVYPRRHLGSSSLDAAGSSPNYIQAVRDWQQPPTGCYCC